MQHPPKSWILDPLCPLYPSIPPGKNVTGSPKDPHCPSKTFIYWSKTHLSQWVFSEEDPGSPGSSSNYSKQDPRSTRSRKSCVEMIQVQILRQMPKKDLRSVKIPDPGSSRSWIPDLSWFLAHVRFILVSRTAICLLICVQKFQVDILKMT